MDAPGMSLFQDAAGINVNNSAQERLEELEELKDSQRREAELQQKLQNGFDDFEDVDSSGETSKNFTIEGDPINGRIGGPILPSQLANNLNCYEGECQYAATPMLYPGTTESPHMVHNIFQNKLCGAGDTHNNYVQDLKGHANGFHNLDTNHNILKQYEELKFLHEMRVKECNNLAEQLEDIKSKSAIVEDSLNARLHAAVSDRDKAIFSRQQAQQLLEASKHRLVDCEQQILQLSEQLASCGREKEQMTSELRAASLALQETQLRLQALQVARSHDTDAMFKEYQERHSQELDRLHNDLLKVKNRLEEKENEIKQLERRCKEREREKDELVIEKSSTVNRLASELELAQSRLASGEASKLKERVAALTAERNTAREQVKEFGSKLKETTQELVLLRSKQQATEKEFDNWRTTLQQILVDSLPDNAYIGEPPSPGKLSTLKDVLSRYKQQIQKIATLQEEIIKRDKKLEHHRKIECELKSKLEEQKAIETQLLSKVALLHNKLELLDNRGEAELLDRYREREQAQREAEEQARAECKNWELKYTELEMEYEKIKSERGDRAHLVQETNADLLKELEKYSAQLKETTKENLELKTLYLKACSNKDAIARELRDLQTKLQREKETQKNQDKDITERLEKERQSNEKLREELAVCREEFEIAKKRIIELQKELTEKQRDFTNKLDKYLQDEKCLMQKEQESCAQCEKYLKTIGNLEEQISKLSVKIATQGSNEELMNELKSKAEFFQNYIMERFQKLQEQRSVGTGTEERADCAACAGCARPPPGEDGLEAKTNIMLKEREIREQIAQTYTLEIKTVEMNCAKRIKEIENEHLNNMARLKQLVEKKAQEVETLKEFILTERAKVQQILNAKENEISVLIKEHNILQQDYQNLKDKAIEYKQKAEKYHEKYRLVEDKCKSDRESSKKSIGEVEKEKETLNTKMLQLESEMQTLKAKYKNAKKTAYMYKEYITKKDEHVNGELSRIQSEYREIFVKLQAQLAGLERARPARELHDYTEMINRLQNDISALAQSRYDEPADWKEPR